jgi:hypothetical protein
MRSNTSLHIILNVCDRISKVLHFAVFKYKKLHTYLYIHQLTPYNFTFLTLLCGIIFNHVSLAPHSTKLSTTRIFLILHKNIQVRSDMYDYDGNKVLKNLTFIFMETETSGNGSASCKIFQNTQHIIYGY